MSKPRLLDLFAGCGGAARGYHAAGFDVTGVDLRRQAYPFELVVADAVGYPLAGFDAIHASPPCQAYSRTKHLCRSQGNEPSRVDLIAPVRERLRSAGVPYAIENVPGAPLSGVVLCGSMFGLKVRRHRIFETSFGVLAPACDHAGQGRPVGVYGRMKDDIPCGGRTARTLSEAQAAMGLPGVAWGSLKEAVPPAYTEFIGRRMIEFCK